MNNDAFSLRFTAPKMNADGDEAEVMLYGEIISGMPEDWKWDKEDKSAADFDRAIKEAVRSGARKLLLRINSPGGSYTASAEIWNALSRLKEKRKLPIVVSMGDYAASGGYFIALPGDKILAEASTVTGSIGVLGGKMVLAGLWDKLEINWGEVKFGDNAGILSANHKFSEREKEVFNRSLDNVYRDFTAKVAAARNISPEKMDKLARGRVWTGIQAVENGLADEIGGIDRAVAYAKQLGGIPPKSRFGIAYYPKAKTLQEKIAELVGGGPKISVNKVINQMGLDIESVNVLKRLQYETVLPPFKLDL